MLQSMGLQRVRHNLVTEQQKQICIDIHILSFLNLPHTPPPLLWVVTEPRAGLPVLHSSFPLAVCFTRGNAFISVLTSQFFPPSPFPIGSSILYVCISIPARQTGSSVPSHISLQYLKLGIDSKSQML